MDRLLLIEDDPHIGELVSIHLKVLNCEVDIYISINTIYSKSLPLVYADIQNDRPRFSKYSG
ncbi:hypothetical protein [Maribellus sp. YY47]|uniref:hypothetical protein n=1 Tax=Maribellus sp. YY47 TaxID=2929486 RepID=UPI0020012CBB|nr:hypothetical protein [Maribellus sp. YY47]MCK3685371.1 hypothetical protein [Maribellus sp. YY47]